MTAENAVDVSDESSISTSLIVASSSPTIA